MPHPSFRRSWNRRKYVKSAIKTFSNTLYAFYSVSGKNLKIIEVSERLLCEIDDFNFCPGYSAIYKYSAPAGDSPLAYRLGLERLSIAPKSSINLLSRSENVISFFILCAKKNLPKYGTTNVNNETYYLFAIICFCLNKTKGGG